MAKAGLEAIDWISIKRDVSGLAEERRKEAMRCERLAAATDSSLLAHKVYWLGLAARHRRMAEVLNDLWINKLEGE